MITSLDFINRTILFPRLHDFHTNYPEIKLNLHSSNANLSLAFGEADVAIRLARPTSGRLHAKKLSDLKYSFFFALKAAKHPNGLGVMKSLSGFLN